MPLARICFGHRYLSVFSLVWSCVRMGRGNNTYTTSEIQPRPALTPSNFCCGFAETSFPLRWGHVCVSSCRVSPRRPLCTYLRPGGGAQRKHSCSKCFEYPPAPSLSREPSRSSYRRLESSAIAAATSLWGEQLQPEQAQWMTPRSPPAPLSSSPDCLVLLCPLVSPRGRRWCGAWSNRHLRAQVFVDGMHNNSPIGGQGREQQD